MLVGRELIRAAEVRATISQIEKFNTAVYTFRDKYGYFPGDLPNASSFGFSARGQYAGQGDGNGILEGIVSNAAGQNGGEFESAGETVVFWVDLSAAHLIEGGFNTASAITIPVGWTTSTSSPNIAAFLPKAKLGKGNHIYAYSYQSKNYFGLSGVEMIGSGGFTGYIWAPANVRGTFSVQEAYSLDKKTDDGMPLTGRVLGQFLHCCGTASNLAGSSTLTYAGFGFSASVQNWPHTWTCFDNGGVAGVQPTYSLNQDGGENINCALSFQFQ